MLTATPEFLEDGYRLALNEYLHDGDEAHLNEAYEFGYEALESGYSLVELIDIHSTALASCLREGNPPLSFEEATAAGGRMLMQATAPFNILQLNQSESNSALRRLNALFEESTNRFAHALHDDAGQMLSVAYLELAQLRNEVPESAYERIDRLTSYLDHTREQLRHLSHELRPPMLEHLGLVPSLRNLVSGYQQRYGLKISLDVPDVERGALREVELQLYRLIHEALANVIRHARAKQAWITLKILPDRVVCEIRDNGKGFNPDVTTDNRTDSGLGLINLRERIAALQGNLDIESTPGQGSCVRATIPLTV
jgi:signal transduction histidine kinase